LPDSAVTEVAFIEEELENAYEGVATGTKVWTDAEEVIVALLLSGTSVNILKSRVESFGLSRVLLKQLCKRVAAAAL
jgi:hypothetical protein